MKGYRKKDVMSNTWNAGTKELEFIENGKSKSILFFMLYLAFYLNIRFNISDFHKHLFCGRPFQSVKIKYICPKVGNFEH